MSADYEYRITWTRLDTHREDSIGCRSFTEATRRVRDHLRHLPESDMHVQRRPVAEWEDMPHVPALDDGVENK